MYEPALEASCPPKSFLLKVEDSEIKILAHPAITLNLSHDIEEYILQKNKMGLNFSLYLDSGMFRCANVGAYIFCFNITDLIEQKEKLHKKLMEREQQLSQIQGLMDIMVHDQKNYLFLLDGYIELARENGFDEDTQREILEILDKLKTLTRMASILINNATLIKEQVNLKEITYRIVNTLSKRAENKAVKIHIECEDIVANTTPLIEEALFNLVDNAIKYTPRGGEIKITCSLSNKHIVLSVADTGPGIPPSIRNIIFQRFKRASSGPGMGLGLAVVKHIVDKLNGEIKVEENEPHGTIFTIILPQK